MGMPLAHRRFTVDEYHRMAEAGILGEDDRVELLDGEIVAMSPIGARHAGAVKKLNSLLSRAAAHVVLGIQDPVVLDRYWEPQPDVTVLKARPDEYRTSHPRPEDVLLVIEVADTTADRDRQVKVPSYARAGIPEVWLVNIPADSMEVYRDPQGGAYRNVRIATRGDTLRPVLLPELRVQVSDVLG